MKAAIVIFVAFAMLSVESASHSKKHKTAMKASEVTEWPHPDAIKEFGVPPEFTEFSPNPIQTPNDDNETSSPSNGKHHGKSNHKSHSY